MDYSQLTAGVNYFQTKWPPNQGNVAHKYSSLAEALNWLHLEYLNANAIMIAAVDGFLNTREWNCHIPATHSVGCNLATGQCSNTCKRSQVTIDLKNAVDSLPPHYANIQQEKIETANFKNTRPDIDFIYSAFLGITPKFGRVAASKLMHMALPDLFVMWDNGIIAKYKIPRMKFRLPNRGTVKNRSYMAFLVLMQENIRHAVHTAPAGALQTHRLPLPRLLDMYNMAVRDGQAACQTCMEQARARWATLGL